MSRQRRRNHEEHLNHEAWAIPYADLITLLLAFFVVMYAISTVNEGKYRVLSDSLVAAFRGAPRTLEPVQVGDKQVGSGADVKTTLVQQSMLAGQPRRLLDPVPIKTGIPRPAQPLQAGDFDAQRKRDAAQAKALERVADEVVRAMDSLERANLVFVRRKSSMVEVEIRTDILYPSASATLSPTAVPIVEKLAKVLQPFPNPIRVEGYTDDRPIDTVAFRSNWELSAARAASVVHLFQKQGIDPHRLSVIGYGQFKPTASNATAQGRNANRRVVIVILSPDGAAPEGVPVQTDPPVQTNAPVQTVPPVQAAPPVQTVPPVQAAPPVQATLPEQPIAAIEPTPHGTVSAP